MRVVEEFLMMAPERHDMAASLSFACNAVSLFGLFFYAD
jgi:hypothetical protein